MENKKKQIKDNLKQILNFDLKKIYENGISKEKWNEYSDDDLKSYIINILNFLKKIQKSANDNFFIVAGIDILDDLNNSLSNIISSYNDSEIMNIDINSITSNHHELLNNFENLNAFFRKNGIYNEINFSSNLIKNINLENKNLYELLEKISKNKEKYEKAIPELEKIIKTQGTINENAIKGQANAFYERAEEHKIGINITLFKKWKFLDFLKTTNYWFLFILIFSVIIGCIVFSFILKSDQTISIGQTILRITSLLVPAYLTIFSANQYLYHKRMNETYMFKNTSLNTMNYLISQNPDIKNEILTKGLEVLFSEPFIEKNNSNENKLIIFKLLSMLIKDQKLK